MDEKISQPFPISIIFFRFLSGFGAGMVGSIVWGIILLFAWSVVGGVLSDTVSNDVAAGLAPAGSQIHPLFLYIVFLAVFLASLATTLSYVLIANAIESKYQARATSITHVFFGNLVILFFVLPVYMLGNVVHDAVGVGMAALLHVFCSGIYTMFVLEIIAGTKRPLLHLYGILLGIIIFFCFGMFIFDGNITIGTFLALPLLFGLFGAGNGISEGVYMWLARIYGNDFLLSEKLYGEDYGKSEEPVAEDENL